MRRTALAWWTTMVLALLASFAVEAQTWSPQRWIEYKPAEGRYRVEMPAAPRAATVPVPIGGGATVPMAEASAVVDRVAYVDYPASVTKNAAPDVILTQVRNGSAAGNTWRDEKKLQLGRSEGREYVVVRSDGGVVVTRAYWVRGRLYQLVVDGKQGVETAADTKRFLESFSLVQ
jgi:hypothetical protein